MAVPKQQTSSPNKSARLDGRRIVVTGANRGIGRAVAEAFVGSGAAVVVHAREHASALASEIGAVAGVDGDLRDRELAGRLAAAVGALGGLDLLVLNAAVLGPMGPLETVDLAAFAEVMDINVDSQLAIFKALLPALLTKREAGSPAVIWLSSALGRIGVAGYGAYCASKHAVEGLSKLAHAEYATRGLVSVTVAPGMVQTEMLKAALGSEDVSQHTHPAVVGAAFTRLAAALGPAHSGNALEIYNF